MKLHRQSHRAQVFLLAQLTALGVATLSLTARAQAEDSEAGYSYELDLDFLDGAQLSGDGPMITVHGRPARVLLIRPRTSFVPELLMTVERF